MLSKGKPAAEGGRTAGNIGQCTYKRGFEKVATQDGVKFSTIGVWPSRTDPVPG